MALVSTAWAPFVKPVDSFAPPDSEAPANSGAAEAHVHGMGVAETAGDKARPSNGAAEEEP